MRVIVRLLAFLILIAGLPVSVAEDVKSGPDRGLQTVDMPLPGSATDSRGDGILRDATGRPVTHDLLGQTLAPFETYRLGGGLFSDTDLQGRWTVLVAWGVWCHDSRNDAENIAAVAAHFAAHPDIDFMSLHVPQGPERLDHRFGAYASVQAYFADVALAWPVALDEDSTVRMQHKIHWTPSYLLIGPDLTVEAFRTDLSIAGTGAVDHFIAEVERYVAGK